MNSQVGESEDETTSHGSSKTHRRPQQQVPRAWSRRHRNSRFGSEWEMRI